MAVAILEREAEILEKIESKNGYVTRSLEDEQHNAQIGNVYAKLINPNAKIDEILGRVPAQPVVVEPAKEVYQPYFVESARTDSILFRADSPVNRRVETTQPLVRAEVEVEEEENEDLRPTPTTIQYKTNGVKKTVEEGKVETRSAEKRSVFSKKEKIAIAVVIGVIIAMFALIIVNSAIISGINAEVSSLQSTLTTVKASYASVSDEVNSLISNAVKDAENFAIFRGMIK